jgi:hypothetical protein
MKWKSTKFVEHSFIHDNSKPYQFPSQPYRYLLYLLYAVRHNNPVLLRAAPAPVYKSGFFSFIQQNHYYEQQASF